MNSRTLLSATPLLAALLLPVGLSSDRPPVSAPAAREPAWREVRWPLPRDQFPAGRAFACDASDCGARLRVTVRAKVGFCNCLTGVSDDDELERVGDVDLLGPRARPRDPGRAVTIGAMSGRARLYEYGPDGAREAALSIAYNEKCDVVVATATLAGPNADDSAAFALLGAPRLRAWVEKSLGL